MWFTQTSNITEMYTKYNSCHSIVFYVDAILYLMKRKQEMTYSRFYNFMDYLFRVPIRNNYNQFKDCVKVIRDETFFKIIPRITTPYVFDLPETRSKLRLPGPLELETLTQKLWNDSRIDNAPFYINSYIFASSIYDRSVKLYDF